MARVVMATGWELKMDRHIHEFMEDLASDVLEDARRNCPVRTGALKADLDKEVDTKYARIGARSIWYAILVEEGAAPHMIYPRDKEALWWAGLSHPVASVNHPGSPATHFLRNALYRTRGGI